MSNIKNKKNRYQLTLLDEMESLVEEALESRENLNQLFTTLEGDELVESVIYNAQRSVFELHGWTIDMDFDLIDHDETESLQADIRERLTEVIAQFISDEHREAIVRCHARGLSTTEAVATLILEDRTMKRLSQRDAIGEKKLKELLISRLAYLKPGTARWPEKKYGAVWREERQLYTQEINNTPFSTPAERIALLANHAERVNHTLKSKQHSVNDLQVLTGSLTRTLESIEKLSPTDQQASPNLLTPQLAGLLERFTIALEAFQKIAHSSDTNTIVEVIERLTLALQPLPEQLAIVDNTEENTPHDKNQIANVSQD